MGFLWSQPERHDPDHTLKTSLLQSSPELIFHSGDLLLVPASALEITLNRDLWSKVAIVVHKHNKVFAFSNGNYSPIGQFLLNFPNAVCRPLHCIRYTGFVRDVQDAASRTQELLLSNVKLPVDAREGYCAGTVLGILGLIHLQTLTIHFGQLRPRHFAPGGPLELKDYTRECWNVH
tara:strand:+ start:26 stop:556 length:531 start_codon:yes stop_codon:yes gene_type:complete